MKKKHEIELGKIRIQRKAEIRKYEKTERQTNKKDPWELGTTFWFDLGEFHRFVFQFDVEIGDHAEMDGQVMPQRPISRKGNQLIMENILNGVVEYRMFMPTSKGRYEMIP